MKIKNKIISSIIVVNYNNEKLVSRCIENLINQTYKSIEIIFVDDNSNDNSLSIVKAYKKNIKIIKTRKKTNIPGYDQMNAYYQGFKKAKGDLIFFLDSDDFYKKDKVKKIVKYFEKNKNINFVCDKPYIYFNRRKFYKYILKPRGTHITPWPRFSPQSCISVRRNYLKKIFNKIKIRKYPTIWFDFRISFQSYIDFRKINFINKYLTYYQQSNSSASSKYKRFSKKWWIRRKEAHDFASYLMKKNSKKITKNLDEIVTNTFNYIFRIQE